MESDLSASVIVALTLMWFVSYWIVGGMVFSVVSLTRFLHIHKARFSCLFTLLSVAAAYGAAWIGAKTFLAQSHCAQSIQGTFDIFSALFTCADREIFSSGLLGFLMLIAVGVVMMFLFRHPTKKETSAR